ncbi:MAG: acetyl-CoA carboxylase biotin carboxyl carrier protein [Candidatus Brocadiia bacterium]
MDIEAIRKLVEELTDLMDARKLDELEVDCDGVKLVLRRGGPAHQAAPVLLTHSAHGPQAAPGPHAEAPSEPQEQESAHRVVSPMVGTFYRAPAPDADPYVDMGDEVAPDTVLCIIEAMKVMNELKAEVEGTVQAACVENGEAVEYGQTLFLIAPRQD